MPGNLSVANVSPSSTVLPNSLSTSFTESLQFPLLVQAGYHDATVERSLVVDGVNPSVAIRSWRLTKRLTTAQLSALVTFFQTTVLGGLRPFYWYPNFADFDATGSSSTGRVMCVFVGPWSESLSVGRHDVPSIELREVA